jgi:Holliday junction resolvase-like predicted endonuclease
LTAHTTILGLEAEKAVGKHLRSLGYTLLDSNWRRPWGELDLVVVRDRVIHFVEVKASTRSTPGFEPFLRADARKMHKVRRTAQTWLSAHRYGPDTEWQMDIASVIMKPAPAEPDIELFEQVS